MSRRHAHQKSLGYTYAKVPEFMASPTEPLNESRRTNHPLRVYRGLNKLEEAEQPSHEDRQACSDAVSMIEALVEMGEASDDSGLVGSAAEALARVGWHGTDSGGYRLEGESRAAERDVVACYADLLAQRPARTVIKSHRHCERHQRERYAPQKSRAHNDVQVTRPSKSERRSKRRASAKITRILQPQYSSRTIPASECPASSSPSFQG